SVASLFGGRRSHADFRPDIAGGTRPIVDDYRLAEPLRQPLTDQACDDVGRAAGRKRDGQTHPPRWVGLRPWGPRYGPARRERCSAGGEMQKLPSVGKFHFEPPSLVSLFDHLASPGEYRRRHVEAESRS